MKQPSKESEKACRAGCEHNHLKVSVDTHNTQKVTSGTRSTLSYQEAKSLCSIWNQPAVSQLSFPGLWMQHADNGVYGRSQGKAN